MGSNYIYLWNFIFLLVSMHFFYILSIASKKFVLVDLFWASGFLIVNGFSYLSMEVSPFITGQVSSSIPLSRPVMFAISTIWSFRLFFHLWSKIANMNTDDPRYAAIIKGFGKRYKIKSYFFIYLLQFAILFIINLPIIEFYRNNFEFRKNSYLGIGIAIFGLIYESVADFQLINFIIDQKDRNTIMKKGLWKLSRHPNYFGEIVYWWGISLFTFNHSENFLSFLPAVVITILLTLVSGVPITENRLKMKAEYTAYKKITPILIPNPILLFVNEKKYNEFIHEQTEDKKGEYYKTTRKDGFKTIGEVHNIRSQDEKFNKK